MNALLAIIMMGQIYVAPDGHGGSVVGGANQIRQYQERQSIAAAQRRASDARMNAQVLYWKGRAELLAGEWAKAGKTGDEASVTRAQGAIRAASSELQKSYQAIAAKKIPKAHKQTSWDKVVGETAKKYGMSVQFVKETKWSDLWKVAGPARARK